MTEAKLPDENPILALLSRGEFEPLRAELSATFALLCPNRDFLDARTNEMTLKTALVAVMRPYLSASTQSAGASATQSHAKSRISLVSELDTGAGCGYVDLAIRNRNACALIELKCIPIAFCKDAETKLKEAKKPETPSEQQQQTQILTRSMTAKISADKELISKTKASAESKTALRRNAESDAGKRVLCWSKLSHKKFGELLVKPFGSSDYLPVSEHALTVYKQQTHHYYKQQLEAPRQRQFIRPLRKKNSADNTSDQVTVWCVTIVMAAGNTYWHIVRAQ